MAGRKPIKDKARPVTIYIKQSRIEELGGIDATRELAYQFITTVCNRKLMSIEEYKEFFNTDKNPKNE